MRMHDKTLAPCRRSPLASLVTAASNIVEDFRRKALIWLAGPQLHYHQDERLKLGEISQYQENR